MLSTQVVQALLHTAWDLCPGLCSSPRATQEEGISLGSGNSLLGTVPKRHVSHPSGSHSQPSLQPYSQQTHSFQTLFPLTSSPATLSTCDCS